MLLLLLLLTSRYCKHRLQDIHLRAFQARHAFLRSFQLDGSSEHDGHQPARPRRVQGRPSSDRSPREPITRTHRQELQHGVL